MFNTKVKNYKLMIKIYRKLKVPDKEICRLLEITSDEFSKIMEEE